MRSPHVLLTEEEVTSACDFLLGEPRFVFDIETREVGEKPDPRTNEIVWFGLGTRGQNFLIPCSHPKGIRLSVERKVKTAACELYQPGDPRGLTPLGRPSYRMVPNIKLATYAKAPKQLEAGVVAQLIKPLLFSDRPIIGHNVKFDLESIAKYFRGEIPPGPYHDTLILQHIIDERLTSYGLKELSIDWFKPKDPKAWYPSMGKAGIDNFGLDEVARYLAKDLRYCWYLYHRLAPKLGKRNLLDAYRFEMSLYPVIMDMEQAGFPINKGALDLVGTELEGKLAEITSRCYELAGDQFALSNTGIKRWIMFGEGDPQVGENDRELASQHLKALNYTPKTHTPQLNQAALEYYSDRGNEMAALFLQWSTYEKLRGTFVVGLDKFITHRAADKLPRIHTSFKLHGTKTGRLSAESPNLHQLPRGTVIRELFVAGPGHVLIVADYDQIELRCAAEESGDPEMERVFKSGEDVHRTAAAVMFQRDPEDITDDLRQVGKTQNFAVLYGAGENKIAFVAGCTTRRARQLIARYYDTFAGLEPWKAEVLRTVRRRCDPANMGAEPPYVLIPPSGRLRRLPELLNYLSGEEYTRFRAERQAINAIVQGFASNITKLAMLDIHEKLKPYPARMLLQVHDEIIVRVEETHADEVLELVTVAMSGVKNGTGGPILGSIPLIVSAKVGYSWASAKGK